MRRNARGKGKTSSTAPTIMHRRGRCLHRPALPRSLSAVGRGDHTSPPGIAPQFMKKPCHCEGAPRPWRSVSPSAAVFMSPTAPFLSAAKEREERMPPKPRFWNPFRGQDTARSGTLQPRELSTAKFAPCIRIVSASPSATRSALVLAWRDGGNLCVCRVMRNISCHRFVGDDAHIVPPYCTPCPP